MIRRDNTAKAMFKCAASSLFLRIPSRYFFAIVALATVLLFISTVGRFYPSGDLALFISTAGSVDRSTARGATKNWEYFQVHGRDRRELGCSNVNVDNTTSNGAHIALRHLKPWQFLPDYKNPCWLEGGDIGGNNFRCLPYFYLAGFPKCGTTDLYFRLTQHPYIVPAADKEPHYMTRFRTTTNCATKYKYLQASTKCCLQKYATTYFENSAKNILKNKAVKTVFSNVFEDAWESEEIPSKVTKSHRMITVDGSASTAWDNRRWRSIQENRGCPEPVIGPADVITAMNPDVRILMILRDPTDRLYSDYVYFKHGEPASKEDFHERVKNSVKAFRNCTSREPFSLCLLEKKDVRLQIGLYHVFISDWLRVLPPSRLLVLHSESYRANVTDALEQVFRFLELPPLTRSAMASIASMKEKNTTKKKSAVGEMLPETEALLRQFYSEHNQRLAQILKDDRFAWRR